MKEWTVMTTIKASECQYHINDKCTIINDICLYINCPRKVIDNYPMDPKNQVDRDDV